MQGKKTLLYLIPCAGYFVASFALSDRACRAAQRSNLSEPVLRLIESAPAYSEGRGLRLEVRSRRDLADVRKLLSIKVAS